MSIAEIRRIQVKEAEQTTDGWELRTETDFVKFWQSADDEYEYLWEAGRLERPPVQTRMVRQFGLWRNCNEAMALSEAANLLAGFGPPSSLPALILQGAANLAKPAVHHLQQPEDAQKVLLALRALETVAQTCMNRALGIAGDGSVPQERSAVRHEGGGDSDL